MIRLLTTLMLAISLLVLPSCEEPKTHGTMRINLEQGTRSIVPSGYPLEVEEYRITGEGPQGADFEVKTERTSITIEGLIAGEWILEAEGMNSHGDVLVRGDTVFAFSASNPSTTITLDELIGTGSLKVTLEWDPSLIVGDAEVELSIRPQYGSDTEKVLTLSSINEAAGTASYSGSGYDAGSYVLSAKLYDSGILVAGSAEAVRIAGDQESEGKIVFDLNKNPTEPGTLEIINSTGVPVTFTIEGIDDTVEADTEISVSLVSSADSVENYQVSWYLNGEKLGEGSTLKLTPSLGVHRLDAVASSSLIGSTSSATLNFEAVTSVAEGVPNQGGIVRDGTGGLNLGSDTLVHFMPNGNLMIFSNEDRTVQIGRILRNSITIEHEMSFSSLGITGTVSTFAVDEYSSSVYKVLVGVNNPFAVKLYNYSPSNHSMTKAVEANASHMHIDHTAEQDVAPVYCDHAAIALKMDNSGIIVVMDRDRKYMNYILFRLDETSPEDFVITNRSVMGLSENGIIPYLMTNSKDGYAFAAPQLYNVILKYKDAQGSLSEGFIEFAADEFVDTPTGLAFISDSTMLVQTSEYLTVIEQESASHWIRKNSEIMDSPSTSGLSSSSDYKYAYYIDQTNDELVTLAIVDSGQSYTEIARTPLELDGADTIAISPSGVNMVLMDESNPDSLAIMRIKR